ncbi:hypothetical protein ACJX0J_016296, partial [Zea mays]
MYIYNASIDDSNPIEKNEYATDDQYSKIYYFHMVIYKIYIEQVLWKERRLL